MPQPIPGIILIVTLLCVRANIAVAAATVAITARQMMGNNPSEFAGDPNRPVGRLQPNPWGSMTCMAMCGNGCRTGLSRGMRAWSWQAMHVLCYPKGYWEGGDDAYRYFTVFWTTAC